jgi:hypothetical protein
MGHQPNKDIRKHMIRLNIESEHNWDTIVSNRTIM